MSGSHLVLSSVMAEHLFALYCYYYQYLAELLQQAVKQCFCVYTNVLCCSDRVVAVAEHFRSSLLEPAIGSSMPTGASFRMFEQKDVWPA